MPSYTTEGIILKRKDFGETDRILTVFTLRFGKISLVAKGVRRITSRRAGNIEVLNRTKLYIYKGRNYTLNEAESIETFQVVKDNLTLATSAFHIIELIDRLTVEEQPSQEVFNLLVTILQLLEKNPRQIFIRAFEVKLLSILGFWSIEAIPHLDQDIKSLLENLQYYSWSQINEIKLSEAEAKGLESILQQLLERTLESHLRSIRVMKKLKA